jgi:PBP1b-binding outer membrane lipoprotein LpoB
MTKRKEPAPKEKAAKKPKVSAEQTALTNLEKALAGPVGATLPADVQQVLPSLQLAPILLPAKETRSDLAAKIATLVGEALATANASFAKSIADAAAAVDEATADLQAKQSGVDAATTTQTGAAEKKAEIEAAVKASEETIAASEESLAKTEAEMKNLDKAKAKYTKLSTDLAGTSATLKSPESTGKKDGKTVLAILKPLVPAESMLSGVSAALGKFEAGGFDAQILGEAVKVIDAKLAETSGILENWDGHVASLQAKKTEEETAIATAKEAKTGHSAGLKEAENALKEAKKAVKAAKEILATAQKDLDAKTKAKTKAEDVAKLGADAAENFALLLDRTEPPAEETLEAA